MTLASNFYTNPWLERVKWQICLKCFDPIEYSGNKGNQMCPAKGVRKYKRDKQSQCQCSKSGFHIISEVQIWLQLPLPLKNREPIKCDKFFRSTNHERNRPTKSCGSGNGSQIWASLSFMEIQVLIERFDNYVKTWNHLKWNGLRAMCTQRCGTSFKREIHPT